MKVFVSTKYHIVTLKEFIMALHHHTPKQRKEIKSQAKKSSTPAKKTNKAAKK